MVEEREKRRKICLFVRRRTRRSKRNDIMHVVCFRFFVAANRSRLQKVECAGIRIKKNNKKRNRKMRKKEQEETACSCII